MPDHRDLQYEVTEVAAGALPTVVDMRSKCPPVYDQGQLGSCTANSIGGAYAFECLKQALKLEMPARLFIYYNERSLEGTISQDAGAVIRDGLKVVNTLGVPAESLCPYDIAKFTHKPSAAAFKAGLKNLVSQYLALDNTNLVALKTCLAAGFPFVFGFTVYSSFESEAVAASGIVPMPSKKEAVLGGHAVMCVGYDDTKQVFIVRNSWGSGWGQAGYFTIPYAYLTNKNLASDFWTMRVTVEGA